MARRSNSQTDETPTDTTVEAPVESNDTKKAAEKTPEVPVDLGPFQAAVNEAITHADENTGELSLENLAPVNEAYRQIDGVKGKNSARGWVEDQMKAAIMGSGEYSSLDQAQKIQLARSFVAVKDGLSAGSGGGSTKTPTDPTEAFVQRVVALRLAEAQVVGTVPDGVSPEWETKASELASSLSAQVDAYATWAGTPDTEESPRGDAPEVSPVVRQAFKLAQGKASGGNGGGSTRPVGAPRRSIETHMKQVFEGLDSGAFLTVNEIAKIASTEYGTDRPSAGAVSAHLFKTSDGVPFKNDIYEGVADGEKSRGARKI